LYVQTVNLLRLFKATFQSAN